MIASAVLVDIMLVCPRPMDDDFVQFLFYYLRSAGF